LLTKRNSSAEVDRRPGQVNVEVCDISTVDPETHLQALTAADFTQWQPQIEWLLTV